MQEQGALRGADHLDVQASAVRDAWELVVPGERERRAAMGISIAQRRAAHWQQGAPEQEDLHAHQAAKDSSLAWEQILSRESGALLWHAVPRLPE